MKYKDTKDFGNLKPAEGCEATSQALRGSPPSVLSESNTVKGLSSESNSF